MLRFTVLLICLLTLAMAPSRSRAACTEIVNDPDIHSLSQEGTTIVFDWIHNCEWDHSLVRWSRIGKSAQVERPADTDHSFFVLKNVRRNTVYTFLVKGCDSPLIGADTCDPIWLKQVLLTCGGPRTSCSTDPGGVSPRRIVSTADKCLDAHAPDQLINGARIQMWECKDEDQQVWILRGQALMTKNGKCLDVHAPDQNFNGAKVQLWDCNGSPQQRWTIKADGSIRSAAGKCLDVHQPDQRRNGGRVQVWDCNGEPQQGWAASGW